MHAQTVSIFLSGCARRKKPAARDASAGGSRCLPPEKRCLVGAGFSASTHRARASRFARGRHTSRTSTAFRRCAHQRRYAFASPGFGRLRSGGIWLVFLDFSHRRYARHNVPVREPSAGSAPRLPTPCPPHAALRDRVGTSSSARPRVFASRRVCPGVDHRASPNSPPLTLPSVRRVRPLVPASLQALTPTRETRRRSWVILPKAPRRRPSPTGPPRLPRSSPPRVRPPRVRQIRPSGQTLVAPFVPRGFGILSRSRLPPPTRPTDPSPPSLPSPLVAQWAARRFASSASPTSATAR